MTHAEIATLKAAAQAVLDTQGHDPECHARRQPAGAGGRAR